MLIIWGNLYVQTSGHNPSLLKDMRRVIVKSELALPVALLGVGLLLVKVLSTPLK